MWKAYKREMAELWEILIPSDQPFWTEIVPFTMVIATLVAAAGVISAIILLGCGLI